MGKYKIKSATACYTGGGIYIYYGQLTNGLFFRAVDDWEVIYICTKTTDTEEADYEEFYDKYTVDELTGDDFKAFWNAMLRHIINKGKAMGIWLNYSQDELQARIIK